MSTDFDTDTTLGSEEASKAANAVLYEQLMSRDPEMQKEGEETLEDFTRTKMREEGIIGKIIPQKQLANEDIDKATWTDDPIKIFEIEPDSPGAISVGFASQPDMHYIRGSKYVLHFQRILSPRFTKDVMQLRTWVMDIRQVLSDNAIKDMMAEEDGRAFAAVNTAVVGANVVHPYTGSVQYSQILGGITRDSWIDSMKVMPNNDYSLEVHTVVINHITVNELAKFPRSEMGGDLSQAIMQKGWVEKEFYGKRLIITIKKGIVATNVAYHWANPDHIGKNRYLEENTMYVRREAYMLEFFMYKSVGLSYANFAGLAKAEFI